jgi:hypothetical protein
MTKYEVEVDGIVVATNILLTNAIDIAEEMNSDAFVYRVRYEREFVDVY